jgi:RecA/RadA recombinase
MSHWLTCFGRQDTEGTFRPARLEAVAKAHGVDYQAALENILTVRAQSTDHQTEMVKSLSGLWHLRSLFQCFAVATKRYES